MEMAKESEYAWFPAAAMTPPSTAKEDIDCEHATEDGAQLLELIGGDYMGMFDAGSAANAAFNMLGVRQFRSE
eukprot:9046568-Pyramimonas_sp.AAC.1